MRKQTSSLVLMAVLCTSLLAGASAEPNKQERLFVTGDAQGHVTSVTDAIRLQNPDALSELADETILSNRESFSYLPKTVTLDPTVN